MKVDIFKKYITVQNYKRLTVVIFLSVQYGTLDPYRIMTDNVLLFSMMVKHRL